MAVRVYFMAPVRGRDGDDVSGADKAGNISIALQVADWIESNFPSFDLFVPHKYERVLEVAMLHGVLDSTSILDMYVAEAGTYPLGIRFVGNGESPGADREQAEIEANGGIVVEISFCGDDAMELIADAAMIIRERQP